MRPIINLKPLNQWVVYQHFKMEGIHLVLDMVEPYEYFTKIDLKDAYLTLAIATEHRKYLRFRWGGAHVFQKSQPRILSCRSDSRIFYYPLRSHPHNVHLPPLTPSHSEPVTMATKITRQNGRLASITISRIFCSILVSRFIGQQLTYIKGVSCGKAHIPGW